MSSRLTLGIVPPIRSDTSSFSPALKSLMSVASS